MKPTLRLGSTGSHVRRLQTLWGIESDGIFGARTHAAVQRYQSGAGLIPDGIVGPLTWAALEGQPSPAPLDPRLPASRNQQWPRHREAEMNAFFGRPGTNLVRITPPYQLYYAGRPVPTITVNAKIAAPVLRILNRVLDHYGRDGVSELKLDQYDGCYNNRSVRGGTRRSTHAWAAAIDWWAAQNQLSWGRPRARLSAQIYIPWWEAWEAEGFVSLGRARNYDWMHVQAARL